MPFIKLHEYVKYGKYATNTAMDGFAASDAAVMVCHSADDEIVPIEYGYDLYYNKYKDDPRFLFFFFEDKGHDRIFNDTTYQDELNEKFDQWADTLEYDYQAKENKDRFKKDKADYIHNNLDREKWCNRLDTDVFDKFLNFYDEHIN